MNWLNSYALLLLSSMPNCFTFCPNTWISSFFRYFLSSFIINCSICLQMSLRSPWRWLKLCYKPKKSIWSQNRLHNCWKVWLSLSFLMLLKTIKQGMLRKISASLHSTCSLKTGYWEPRSSIWWQKDIIYSRLVLSKSWSLPRVQELS